MALNFKINGTTIYPIVNTTITERIGTFNDGTLPLELTNIKSCFLPITSKLTIEDTETNSKWIYVIVADDVETVTKMGTIYYRHNLTVRSGAYEGKKHILRNTNFRQPKSREFRAELNFTVAGKGRVVDSTTHYIDASTDFMLADYEEGKMQYSSKDIKLNQRLKIANVRCVCKTKTYTFANCSDVNSYSPSFSTLNGVYEDKWLRPKCFLRRYDGLNLTASVDATQVDLDDPIFRNIYDFTVFKLEPDYGATYHFADLNPSAIGALSVIHFEFIFEVYYYSMYDIVDILYKQSQKYYNGANSLELACLEMTDTSKINELKNIIAPEISFNGLTYYDALYQLFSYIDAIPVVDENGNLSFEYLNNNTDERTSVETQRADEKISINDEYYTTKLVANYQNARQENAIVYPNKYRYVRANTKGLGIPTSSDYILKLPKPIDYIDKVEIYAAGLKLNIDFKVTISGSRIEMQFVAMDIVDFDMSSQVVEQEEYNLLNYYGGNDFYASYQNQNNVISYARGSDYIDLLNMANGSLDNREVYMLAITSAIYYFFGIAITSYQNANFHVSVNNEGEVGEKKGVFYRVTYHALFDGRVEQASTKDRYEGESYVAQDSAEVSLNRMGNNLQGLIAKVGNETENITFNVSSYGSRVKLGSIWENDDHEKFIANVVQTTFSTSANKVIVNAQFTKNFNMLSQYTKIDQQKRFYEISERLTSKGYENITEYLYLSYEKPANSYYESSAAQNEYFLLSLVGDTLKCTNQKRAADYATFRPYTFEGEIEPSIADYIYIPLHSYGSGNSICFEMDYDNSINAGDRLTGNGSSSDPLFTKTTLYTEEKGFADKVELTIWSAYNNYPRYSPDFPRITTIEDSIAIKIDNFCYYKKPSEIFHLNYALAFISESPYEFFVGDKFVNNNAVIPNSVLSASVSFSYGDNLYSILDNKNINNGHTNMTLNAEIQFEDDKKYIKVTINLSNTISCKSWALIDENNNILIASNKTLEEENQIIFYVIPRRNRI